MQHIKKLYTTYHRTLQQFIHTRVRYIPKKSNVFNGIRLLLFRCSPRDISVKLEFVIYNVNSKFWNSQYKVFRYFICWRNKSHQIKSKIPSRKTKLFGEQLKLQSATTLLFLDMRLRNITYLRQGIAMQWLTDININIKRFVRRECNVRRRGRIEMYEKQIPGIANKGIFFGQYHGYRSFNVSEMLTWNHK